MYTKRDTDHGQTYARKRNLKQQRSNYRELLGRPTGAEGKEGGSQRKREGEQQGKDSKIQWKTMMLYPSCDYSYACTDQKRGIEKLILVI